MLKKSDLQALVESWRQTAKGYREDMPNPWADKDAKDRDYAKADKIEDCANDLESLIKRMDSNS